MTSVKVIHLFVRNLLLYTILLIFFWQIVGFNVGFEIAHSKIKKEVKMLLKNGVSKDERVVFSFSKQDLKGLIWVKKNEFIFQESFYDVIERRSKGSKTIFECISDKQETVLFKDLSSIIDSNLSDQNDDGLIKTVKTFNVKYLSFYCPMIWESVCVEEQRISKVDSFSDKPLLGFVGIEIAPPEA